MSTYRIDTSMKCVCGYEFEQVVSTDSLWLEAEITKGDDEFTQIEGSFHITHERYDYKTIKTVKLFACPKCGTVRMNE